MTSFQKWEGYNDGCCMDEFTVGNLQKQNSGGWVFWYPNTESSLPTQKDKIQCFLEAVISHLSADLYIYTYECCMVQFWGMKDEGCLTTVDQPFAFVGRSLRKGYSWYRKLCEAHQYSVKEGAASEAGPVGRVYLSGNPESTPDLRLYSVKEFPLRNEAARCGFTKYLALPLFDLLNKECYGVLELVSYFLEPLERAFSFMDHDLKKAGLNFTLSSCSSITAPLGKSRLYHQPESEIAKMMKLAIKLVPQLHLVQVWSVCSQCVSAANNLSCIQRIAFIEANNKTLNYCDKDRDKEIMEYVEASKFHKQQIGKWILLISGDSKSRFCRNICDFSMSDNPLAHYAQQARLSFCFVVHLQNVHHNNMDYFVEFFFQSNDKEDASFLHLLLKIMEMELKNFKFEKSVFELRKSSALTQEYVEWKHHHSEKVNILNVMKDHMETYSLWDFKKYLHKADLSCLQPCEESMRGWLFGTEKISDDGINNNTALPIFIQEKIKKLMSEIATKWVGSLYRLVQFWALGMKEDRPCLETSDQPFVLTSLDKGLAFYRKQCMKCEYFMDEEVGLVQRVFRSGHPEISPDLRLYSITEFPLRDDATHCHLQDYLALPILDQHKKCIGVLECVGTFHPEDLMVYSIPIALKAAGFDATQINFKKSSTRKVDKSRRLAETEIFRVFKLFWNIPHVYYANAWVTYSECDSTSSNISCMELIQTFKQNISCLSRITFRQVQTRKGIVGMVLASENKSCFCRNLSHFSIADEPHSHYLQRGRLDVGFAICLQSSHTGELLYVLEFFLCPGPTKYEYISSFLHILFPILKQQLPSFRVASGQQLGDDLVVDVIEFPPLTSSELMDESYSSPFKFKTVLYGQDEPQCSNNEIHHIVQDVMDSVPSSIPEEKPSNAATSDSRAKDVTKKDLGRKRIANLIRLDDLEPHIGKTRNQVAQDLGVGISTIKRACTDLGIGRWSKSERLMKKRFDSLQTSSSSSLPPLDTSLLTNQLLINSKTALQPVSDLLQESETVMVKAKYEDEIIKFKLCVSSTMKKLKEEVAKRLDLEKGSFKLRYFDEENDNILLACDEDLQLCIKTQTAGDNTTLHLFVQLIPKLMLRQAIELRNSKTTSVVEPAPRISSLDDSVVEIPLSVSKGGLKDLLPVQFQPYVVECKDVVADGHCGFRAVAALMEFGEENWARVRQNMITELSHHLHLYQRTFKEDSMVLEMLNVLNCFTNIAPLFHWFKLPYMGFLVASMYNVVVITLSNELSLTYLPLRTAPPKNPKSICVGYVNENHFIQVFLRDDCPLPPVTPLWFDNKFPDANGWLEAYEIRAGYIVID